MWDACTFGVTAHHVMLITDKMTYKRIYVQTKSFMLHVLVNSNGQYLSAREAKEIASIAFDILADNPSLRDDDWDIPPSAHAYRDNF